MKYSIVVISLLANWSWSLVFPLPTRRARVAGIRFGFERDMDELRRDREENDFLAIATSMGVMSEADAASAREEDRLRDKKREPGGSKFGDWMGGMLVGTPFSAEKAADEYDEDDILVKLARRVEERREELATEEISAKPQDSIETNKDQPVDRAIAEPTTRKVRRRRKVPPEGM